MRSYIGPQVLADLCDNISNLHQVEYEIKTFIGSQCKSFRQLSLGIEVPGSHLVHLPILVDDALKLKFEAWKAFVHDALLYFGQGSRVFSTKSISCRPKF